MPLILRRHELDQTALLRLGRRLCDLRAREVRATYRTYFALVHQVVQGRKGLLDRRGRIVVVDLVKVDPLRAQPPQTGLQAADDVRSCPPSLAALAHHCDAAKFRCQYDLFAARAQDLTNKVLGLPIAVHVRSVEEGHARVEGSGDHGATCRQVNLHAEIVAPEADTRDLDAARPELLEAHAAFSLNP